MKLVWEENFSSSKIDKKIWMNDIGDGSPDISGWGNDELQFYTDRSENCRIENGILIIEAHREKNYEGFEFISARLKTKNKMEFKYGTLEAKIRIPIVGDGLWPAFWLLGAVGNWPARGEIDIMEAGAANSIDDGTVNRQINAATHWENKGQQADFTQNFIFANDLNSDFHIYKLSWDPEFIRVSIDNHQYFEMDIHDPEEKGLEAFHQRFYLILNLAVGGNYPEIHDADEITAPLPARLEVEYIRLFQNSNDGSELYLNGEKVAN